jgi:hypothetical protein
VQAYFPSRVHQEVVDNTERLSLLQIALHSVEAEMLDIWNMLTTIGKRKRRTPPQITTLMKRCKSGIGIMITIYNARELPYRCQHQSNARILFSIHLLRHGLDRIDETSANGAHRHEYPAHDPNKRTKEDEPILPRFDMSYRQWREVVRNQQSR